MLPGNSGMLSQPGYVQLGPLYYRVAIDNKGAPLYRQRPAPFYPAQVNQADMGEAQVSPDGRLPFSLRDLSGGSGLAQQPLVGDFNRFDRCGDAEGEGVDATLAPDGPLILAGKLWVPTIPSVVPDGHLAGVLWHGGWAEAYLSQGSHVFATDGTTLAHRGTLPAHATDGITAFLGTGDVTGTEDWYQPCGYGTPLQRSTNGGGSWSACLATGGLTGGVQSMVELDGECVVAMKSPRLGNAMVAVFDDGGNAPTLFNVIDPIGDAAIDISRLVVFNGRVLVLKDREGVYLLSGDRRTLEEELFPELRGERLYYEGVTVWRGILWLPTGAGVYAISPAGGGFALEKAGPTENETSSLAPRAPRGPVTALAGDAHNLYAFRENPQGPSWVYKANVLVQGGQAKTTWFPFGQQADYARCRVMAYVAPCPVGADAADADAPRLLFDRQTYFAAEPNPPVGEPDTFAFGWYHLPGQGRDPRADADYPYAPAGTLYYSRLLARFPAINKAWYSLTPLCAPLDRKLDGYTQTGAQTIRLRWKLDTGVPDPSGQPFGYTEGPLQRSGVGAKNHLVPPLYGRGFDCGIRLTTGDPTTTPQVYSVTAEYDLRPTPVWRHEMTLDLSSGAYAPSGSSGWGDPEVPSLALKTLRGLAGASGALVLTDEWGIAYDVSVPVDGISLRAASAGEAGYSGEIPLLVDVVAVEQRARDQGTWRTVSLYTWRQISQHSWQDLLELQ